MPFLQTLSENLTQQRSLLLSSIITRIAFYNLHYSSPPSLSPPSLRHPQIPCRLQFLPGFVQLFNECSSSSLLLFRSLCLLWFLPAFVQTVMNVHEKDPDFLPLSFVVLQTSLQHFDSFFSLFSSSLSSLNLHVCQSSKHLWTPFPPLWSFYNLLHLSFSSSSSSSSIISTPPPPSLLPLCLDESSSEDFRVEEFHLLLLHRPLDLLHPYSSCLRVVINVHQRSQPPLSLGLLDSGFGSVI